MRKLSDLLNRTKEKSYEISLEEKESFIKLLQSIKEDSSVSLSILDKGSEIVVFAPQNIHDKIKWIWNTE